MGWCTIISIKNIYYSYIWFFFHYFGNFCCKFLRAAAQDRTQTRIKFADVCSCICIKSLWVCNTQFGCANMCIYGASTAGVEFKTKSKSQWHQRLCSKQQAFNIHMNIMTLESTDNRCCILYIQFVYWITIKAPNSWKIVSRFFKACQFSMLLEICWNFQVVFFFNYLWVPEENRTFDFVIDFFRDRRFK